MLNLKNQQIHITHDRNDIYNFNPKIAAAACFLSINYKLLLLKTNNHDKFQHNTWGVPGGKVENNENPEAAVLRELKEETGLIINKEDIKFIIKLYARVNKFDYELYVYQSAIVENLNDIDVQIDKNEHSDFIWVMPEDAIKMNLILGEKELINYIYLKKEKTNLTSSL